MSGTSQKTWFCAVQPLIRRPIGRNIVPGTIEAVYRIWLLSNGAEYRGGRELTKPVLGSPMSPVFVLVVLVYPVEETSVDLRRASEADTEREIVYACDADGLAVYILIDRGNGSQDEVKCPYLLQ